MKKTIFNNILSLTLCLIISLTCILLSGCSNDDFAVYFGVETLPESLDPQRASTYSELLAVRNCFTGLMKLDSKGNAVLGIAEKYIISDDKLTYTFYLGDSEWSNGQKVTAQDVVFGIKRACSPETKSPNTEYVVNILGAKEMLSGKKTTFGVIAKDNKTVEIKLLTPDSNFLYKLTMALFIPCNEMFFEGCKGKYGLGTDYILTNGNFKPVSWSTNNKFIRLNRTTKDNKSLSEVKSLYISQGTSGKDTITRINDGEIGIALNHNGDFKKVNSSKFTIETTYNKNYLIIFNKDSKIGSNQLITEAFAETIDREDLSSKFDSRFKTTLSILPEVSVLNGKTVDTGSSLPKHVFKFNAENARTKFLQALNESKISKFPNTKVLTVEDSSVKSALTEVVAKWQNNLGAYINIETVKDESTLINKVKNGNFTIAFVPVSNDVAETLNMFSYNGAFNIKSDEYNLLIDDFNITYDAEKENSLLIKALEILSKDSSVIPIMSAPSAAIWSNEYKNVIFSKTDLTVDFSIVHK